MLPCTQIEYRFREIEDEIVNGTNRNLHAFSRFLHTTTKKPHIPGIEHSIGKNKQWQNQYDLRFKSISKETMIIINDEKSNQRIVAYSFVFIVQIIADDLRCAQTWAYSQSVHFFFRDVNNGSCVWFRE